MIYLSDNKNVSAVVNLCRGLWTQIELLEFTVIRTLRTFFRILYRWWHSSSKILTIRQAFNVRENNRDFRNHALSQDSSKQPRSSASSSVSIVLWILRPSNLLIRSYSNFHDVWKTSDLSETDVRTFIASASRMGSRWSVALSRRDRYQSGKAGHLAPISLNRIFNPVPLSACRVVYCLTCIQLDCAIRGTLMHDKLAIYLPVHGFTCIRAPRNHLPATMESSYFGYSRGWLAWTQRAFQLHQVARLPESNVSLRFPYFPLHVARWSRATRME